MSMSMVEGFPQLRDYHKDRLWADQMGDIWFWRADSDKWTFLRQQCNGYTVGQDLFKQAPTEMFGPYTFVGRNRFADPENKGNNNG